MIAVLEQTIKNIPCLVVEKKELQLKPLPTVVYFHGFTSAKEHNLPLAFLLAKKGFRVLLPDSMYHGERAENITEEQFQMSFWNIVLKNVEELELIKQYLDEEQLLIEGKIGVAGTSMGGITTAAVLTKYPWIKAGAILMGAPKIVDFAKHLVSTFEEATAKEIDPSLLEETMEVLNELDLSKNINALQNRPLFLWHGDADRVVPFNFSYPFYEEAKNLYETKENIKFVKETNRDHKVSRPAILQTVAWFEKHLIS